MAAFPHFSEDYRCQFIDSGLWPERTLGDYLAGTARLNHHGAELVQDIN